MIKKRIKKRIKMKMKKTRVEIYSEVVFAMMIATTRRRIRMRMWSGRVMGSGRRGTMMMMVVVEMVKAVPTGKKEDQEYSRLENAYRRPPPHPLLGWNE